MAHNLEIQTKYESLVNELRASLPPEAQEKFDNDILLRALLAKNKSIPAAKALLLKYTSARKDYPALFGRTSDPRMEGMLETGVTLHPTFRTPQGYFMFYAKTIEWDPGRHPIDVLIQSILIGVECKSLDYLVQETGYILAIDAQDIGWKYVMCVKPTIMRAFGQVVVSYLPVNLHSIVVFNTNWAVDAIWKVVKPLLPSELANKVVMCGTNKEKLSVFLGRDSVDSQSFVPTPEMRKEFVDHVRSNDHIVQSLRDQYMVC